MESVHLLTQKSNPNAVIFIQQAVSNLYISRTLSLSAFSFCIELAIL